jgi:hypothetical protein
LRPWVKMMELLNCTISLRLLSFVNEERVQFLDVTDPDMEQEVITAC